MKTMEQVFQENLVRLRGNRTQVEIAELAGIPARSYQNCETTGAIPQSENRRAIAKAFGVQEADLFVDNDRYALLEDINPREALDILARALDAKFAPRRLPRGIDDEWLSNLFSAIRSHPNMVARIEGIMGTKRGFRLSKQEKHV